jgi:membrane protease YdiL (CAAX protease family)
MIFLNDKNELRSGWKFAIYVAFFLLIWVATGVALSMLIARASDEFLQNQLVALALNEIALFVPAVAAMLLAVRFVDHRPLSTFGIGFLPKWREHLGLGLVIAAGMLGVLIGGCYLLGYVRIHWTAGQVPATTLLATFVLLLVAALNEELVFRGFPLQVLIEGMGEWPAIIAMSALFGAMHIGNPNSSILGTVNTLVAGILLSLAYVRTRSLWFPYAIHIGWNLGLGFVFGFPLSGIDIASLWTTGTAGSETILGGDYGPEGGLLATFIFAASAVIVERHGYVNPNQAPARGRPRWPDRNRTGNS